MLHTDSEVYWISSSIGAPSCQVSFPNSGGLSPCSKHAKGECCQLDVFLGRRPWSLCLRRKKVPDLDDDESWLRQWDFIPAEFLGFLWNQRGSTVNYRLQKDLTNQQNRLDESIERNIVQSATGAVSVVGPPDLQGQVLIQALQYAHVS